MNLYRIALTTQTGQSILALTHADDLAQAFANLRQKLPTGILPAMITVSRVQHANDNTDKEQAPDA